ncbi:MAG: hypothetical protein QM765_46010 [Myxococcales bacterium]
METLLVALLLVAAAPAHEAHAATCPLDGTHLDVPALLMGRQTGVRLDLRPTGEGDLLPPLVRCASCGLVLESPDEQPSNKAALRRIIESADFKALRAQPSNRLLLAVLADRLGAPAWERGRHWLEAAWEARRK